MRFKEIIKSISKSIKEKNVIYTEDQLKDKIDTILKDQETEVARRLKDRGITVNCCHPGAVATNIGVDRTTGFGKTHMGSDPITFSIP